MPAYGLGRLLVWALVLVNCLAPPGASQDSTTSSGDFVERHPVCGYSHEPRFLTVNASVTSLAMLGVDPLKFGYLDNPNSGLKDQIFIPESNPGDCANALELKKVVGQAVNNVRCPPLSSLSMRTLTNFQEYENAIKESVSFKSEGDTIESQATSSGSGASGAHLEENELNELFRLGGEVVVGEHTCQTHVVSVNLNTRPVFTPNFHRGLQHISSSAKDQEAEESRRTFSNFVSGFGTHYQAETHFGSRLLVMKLFARKAADAAESSQRQSCVSSSFTQNLGTTSSFEEAVYQFGSAVAQCEDAEQAPDVLNSLRLSPTRFFTIGTVPLPDQDHTLRKPVPIHYTLEKISGIFKKHWFDWLGCSEEGATVYEFFEKMTSEYQNH